TAQVRVFTCRRSSDTIWCRSRRNTTNDCIGGNMIGCFFCRSAPLLCAIAIHGCAWKPVVPPVAEQPAIQFQDSSQARPVQLQRVRVKIDRGQPIGRTCNSPQPLYYEGGSFDVDDSKFTDVFRQELEKANYRVVGDPDAVFEDASA